MLDKNYKLSVIFNQAPGMVIRTALILERRGFEIKSLTIESGSGTRYSEMLLEIKGQPDKFDQVQKQLSKLIDVMYVEQVMPVREMAYEPAAAGSKY